MQTTIALDAMGGDHGPQTTVAAAVQVLADYPELRLVLVGQQDVIKAELQQHTHANADRIDIYHASEVVGMHELPSLALRSKKDSSMRVAIDLVKEKTVDACVSAGNTGALMATARYVLKMLPGIDRPAICSIMPRMNGHGRLLDLGANVDVSSEQLFQFAVMGAELASAIDGIEEPTVALLNIGEEEIKGNDCVKQAASLLTNSHLNYVGYAEGNDIFMGNFDVIVCDGFAGNIALKSSEGLAKMITHTLKTEFKNSLYGKLAAAVSYPILKRFSNRMDPRQYNGASLLGLRGIVVKSHGSADAVSFATAIKEAMNEVNHNVPERISKELESIFNERDLA